MRENNEYLVYWLNSEGYNQKDEGIGIIKEFENLNCTEKLKIAKFYNIARYLYLFFSYGGRRSFIDFVEGNDGKIEFCALIVPYSKMAKRYPFVGNSEYSIIACLTDKKYRGRGIYSNQLEMIKKSGISKNGYVIWASRDNIYSNNGIIKAGGNKIQEVVIERKLLGLIVRCKAISTGD